MREALRARRAGMPAWRLESRHGVALLGVFLFGCGWAQAQAGVDHPSIAATIWKWTPLLARGFAFNLAISFLAMALGTVAGFFLGFAQISLLPPVKRGAWLTTHFFRNAPWLVLLFYCMAVPLPHLPRQRMWMIRAQAVVLASGAIERGIAYANNDLPGTMLAGAAHTYVRRYGVQPGSRAVVFANHDRAYAAALALHDAGVAIAGVVDVRAQEKVTGSHASSTASEI